MVSKGIPQGLIIRIPHRLSEKYIRGSGKGYFRGTVRKYLRGLVRANLRGEERKYLKGLVRMYFCVSVPSERRY